MVNESAFGRVLAEYRKRHGMTRSQLAASSGLSYPYVSQLETGLRKPSRKAAAQLAGALGIDPLALEAALPPDDTDSPSFQRSLRAQAALLSGDSRAIDELSLGPQASSGGSDAAGAPQSRDDIVQQLVDLVEELGPDERLDVLADVQKLIMQRLLSQQSQHP